MKSWKTTLFGIMAAIGGGLVAGITTGTIDPAHLPAWFKDAAAILGVVGTAGLGIFARDNDKTSEQVGAGQPAGAGPKLAYLLAGSILGASLWGGCTATPARQAYNAAAIPAVTAQGAMIAWGDYVAKFHPPASDELKVKAAFEKYQAAELAAITAARVYAEIAASGATNSLSARVQTEVTSQSVAQALADLVNLLNGLGLKL